MPFQANNDFVCDTCWAELKKFYQIWRGGTPIADHVGAMLKAAMDDLTASTKLVQEYKDMYNQCYHEQHGETPDDVDRYKYKKLYEAQVTDIKNKQHIIETQQKAIEDQSARINEYQLQELDLMRGFKEVRRKNKEKKSLIKQLRSEIIQLQELVRQKDRTFGHRVQDTMKNLTEKVKLLETELKARPYQNGEQRIAALEAELVEANAKIEGRDLAAKTDKHNHEMAMLKARSDYANLERIEKDTARKLAAAKAQAQQYATNYAELREKRSDAELITLRDATIKRLTEEAKHYEEVAQKYVNELSALRLTEAALRLDLGAMTQDRDILKKDNERLYTELANETSSKRTLQDKYNERAGESKKWIDEVQRLRQELQSANQELMDQRGTITGADKELANKVHGLTTANEIWHDKVKQLEQSLAYEKQCREHEQKQVTDVTHDRDTILARLQKLEETHKHCEASRKHLSSIIDWINS